MMDFDSEQVSVIDSWIGDFRQPGTIPMGGRTARGTRGKGE